MQTAARQWLNRRTERWLFQLRDAEPGEVFLNQRRVFIVPSGAGLAFGALLLVLLIGSINYNLGLGYALTFLCACCAIVDMGLTFQNLAHLYLVPLRAAPVFAGEEAQFALQLDNRGKRERFAIWIDFLAIGAPRHTLDVGPAGKTDVNLTTPSSARGPLRAPRVRLQTRFPLGLFRAWSYWQPDLCVLVYPFPEPQAPPLPLGDLPGSEGNARAGHDDFAGIRSYQAGDPMRHLAWRQIARLDPALGGQLVTKHFEGGAVSALVLDFDALGVRLDLELRLSRMTRWVLDAEQRGLPYAFRLGTQHFAASVGAAHQAACLQALALYGLPVPTR